MSNYSPILSLLRFTQDRRVRSPSYEVTRVEEKPRHIFQCRVKTCFAQATGYGTSKQYAREEAAKAALDILIPPSTSTREETPRDHVEELDSFVKKYRLLSPTYRDVQFRGSSVVCLAICRVDYYTTEGYGANVKEAVDDAARNMLYVLKLIGSIPANRKRSRKRKRSRSTNSKRRSRKSRTV